jgi:phosphopantetheine--protein transferase-like protein
MAVGIDLLHMTELDRLTGRPWFDRYIYASDELAEASGLAPGRRREFLAGRFAAKEAVLKVLQTGLFQGVAPRDIVVRRAIGGAPEVSLRDSAARAARRAGVGIVTVSIAHKYDLVIAVATSDER